MSGRGQSGKLPSGRGRKQIIPSNNNNNHPNQLANRQTSTVSFSYFYYYYSHYRLTTTTTTSAAAAAAARRPSNTRHNKQIATTTTATAARQQRQVATTTTTTTRQQQQVQSHLLATSAARSSAEIRHFSHRHPLRSYNQPGGGYGCEICQLELSGPAYGCRDCGYYLHQFCSELPREIGNRGHSHRLTLRSTPAYDGGAFVCNACRRTDYGFNYHCSGCRYDLHVVCASLPETVTVEGHRSPLGLVCSFPFRNEAATVFCDVCCDVVSRNEWVYRNAASDFTIHVYCAFGAPEDDNDDDDDDCYDYDYDYDSDDDEDDDPYQGIHNRLRILEI